MRIVAVDEGCDLTGDLDFLLGASVVAHLLHRHALNDKSTSLVVLHHDLRGIDGGRVAYAVALASGSGIPSWMV